jgi:sugar phosphate isomerase/epimerase
MTLRIGLQLYSVRRSLAASTPRTLQRLSELGFRYLEAANHAAATDDGIGFGVPATELRTMLGDLGLQIVGTHVNPLDLDRLPAILDYQEAIGCRQIGCDIEFYPLGDRDYVLRRADFFNRVGELCAERGMRFYYHNHYQEFQRLDGGLEGDTVYETLLDHTDPELVFVEMDTYWVYRGGHSPLEWMRRYPERVVILHQKDFPAGAPQPLSMYDGVVDAGAAIDWPTFEKVEDPLCFTEIGTGTLPLQDIIDTALTLPHLEYMLLEQDHTQRDELESIELSRDAFSGYAGISWD